MPKEEQSGVIAGRNAVAEALKGEKAPEKVYLQRGERRGAILPLVEACRARRIPVEEVSREKLDTLTGGVVHQGIAALVSPVEYAALDDVFALAKSRGEKPFLVVVDHVSDPHNLGAILRSCEGAGVHGVILPKHDACPVNATVVKASAGAALHLLLVRTSSTADACRKLKERGVWICALEADGEDYASFDFDLPLALVFGSEDKGISRLVREESDFCVSIPMHGKVNSLNVSCAGAVILYAAEAARRKARG